MNHLRFDTLTRGLAALGSRRDVLQGLTGIGLGLGAARHISGASAKKKRKQKKDKKPKPNAFGCLEVGDACKSAEQCCSGICEGTKGKRKCAAHNAGICSADLDFCPKGVPVFCNVNNATCTCVLTTGNAGFCGDFTEGAEKLCRVCSKDTDCEAEFGPGAACVVLGGVCTPICAGSGGTACVPPCI